MTTIAGSGSQKPNALARIAQLAVGGKKAEEKDDDKKNKKAEDKEKDDEKAEEKDDDKKGKKADKKDGDDGEDSDAKAKDDMDDENCEEDEDDEDAKASEGDDDDDEKDDKKGKKAARKQERARIRAILFSPEASQSQSHYANAAYLALETSMSVNSAIGMLRCMPTSGDNKSSAASSGDSDARERMYKTPNPPVGSEASKTGPMDLAAQIVAAGKKRRGEA